MMFAVFVLQWNLEPFKIILLQKIIEQKVILHKNTLAISFSPQKKTLEQYQICKLYNH